MVIVVLWFEAKVVQELGSWGSVRLEVPGFIKGGVVASFDGTGVEIDVYNVVIHRSVSDEDSGKVMSIEFTAAVASPFDTHTGPKNL
jgi:hypothetical protein